MQKPAGGKEKRKPPPKKGDLILIQGNAQSRRKERRVESAHRMSKKKGKRKGKASFGSACKFVWAPHGKRGWIFPKEKGKDRLPVFTQTGKGKGIVGSPQSR